MSLALLLAGPLLAAQEVRVAAVDFPPYVFKAEKSHTTGLLDELVTALNQAQTDYRFVLVPTAVKRRFRDFEQQRIDLAVFENPDWGWRDVQHVALDMYLEDSEVFVARAEPGRDQRYFDSFEGKRLALYHGYHYAFANFNASPEYLSTTFNATLTHSHDSNLLMVLHKRAEIALVTRSYIGVFLERNRQYAGQLLVSERVDQRYRHQVLLHPQAPITPDQFMVLYETLRNNGQLEKIFSRYQVAVIPPAADNSIAADVAN
ncbi:substrate-binding periplasmic protein [Pseudomonas anguilliseptica]|uniref:substrate-binding periplasmic protein n=1 Tax=Pseudomonas anguilliseptica TaxID=53406 RepID=UPI0022AEEF86|nr:transporter substrate-binding domain-containing protein [Pseudomonas anguilliseptica]MCZ4323602.1 transporter substrate-binding domain-containing protein [Pseudomonas anguilliseptica]